MKAEKVSAEKIVIKYLTICIENFSLGIHDELILNDYRLYYRISDYVWIKKDNKWKLKRGANFFTPLAEEFISSKKFGGENSVHLKDKLRSFLTLGFKLNVKYISQLKEKSTLRVLRNTIPAGYGYTFQDSTLQTYFENKPWYKKNPDFKFSLLTSLDLENVKLLKKLEAE